jgi:hypothetical protein
MEMRIDKPRKHGPALKVDYFIALLIITDSSYTLAKQRNVSLLYLPGEDIDDVGVAENDICLALSHSHGNDIADLHFTLLSANRRFASHELPCTYQYNCQNSIRNTETINGKRLAGPELTMLQGGMVILYPLVQQHVAKGTLDTAGRRALRALTDISQLIRSNTVDDGLTETDSVF